MEVCNKNNILLKKVMFDQHSMWKKYKFNVLLKQYLKFYTC